MLKNSLEETLPSPSVSIFFNISFNIVTLVLNISGLSIINTITLNLPFLIHLF